jgi:hypothetical protein
MIQAKAFRKNGPVCRIRILASAYQRFSSGVLVHFFVKAQGIFAQHSEN